MGFHGRQRKARNVAVVYDFLRINPRSESAQARTEDYRDIRCRSNSRLNESSCRLDALEKVTAGDVRWDT